MLDNLHSTFIQGDIEYLFPIYTLPSVFCNAKESELYTIKNLGRPLLCVYLPKSLHYCTVSKGFRNTSAANYIETN